ALAAIEPAVPVRADMLDALDIPGPFEIGRIERPRHREALLWQFPCRLAQQLFEHRLTVGAVGAEIGQGPVRLPSRYWPVLLGIDRAIKRSRCPRATPTPPPAAGAVAEDLGWGATPGGGARAKARGAPRLTAARSEETPPGDRGPARAREAGEGGEDAIDRATTRGKTGDGRK